MKPLALAASFLAFALAAAIPALAAPAMRGAVIREDMLPPAPEGLATGRDPFNWPPRQEKHFTAIARGKEKDPLAGVRLEGIIYSRKQPLAVINGKINGIGDRIAGYRITAITRTMVSLRRGRTSRNLELPMPALRLGAADKGEK